MHLILLHTNKNKEALVKSQCLLKLYRKSQLFLIMTISHCASHDSFSRGE